MEEETDMEPMNIKMEISLSVSGKTIKRYWESIFSGVVRCLKESLKMVRFHTERCCTQMGNCTKDNFRTDNDMDLDDMQISWEE